ncbi:MAG TPA: hypothetical protein VKV37_08160 [Ktedonobacteraceae bacterium]|jgi:hypothetical protein|nr:hypothetical protein [Ktedonobacteraceae bacterium]
MTNPQDMYVSQIQAEIRKHLAALNALQEALITRAKLQEYTELQFDALAKVAREGIAFVNAVREGDTIGPEWIARRDELAGRARRIIEDASE